MRLSSTNMNCDLDSVQSPTSHNEAISNISSIIPAKGKSSPSKKKKLTKALSEYGKHQDNLPLFVHTDNYDLYMDHLADEQMLEPVVRPKPPKVRLSPRKPKKEKVVKKMF